MVRLRLKLMRYRCLLQRAYDAIQFQKATIAGLQALNRGQQYQIRLLQESIEAGRQKRDDRGRFK